MLTVHVLYNTQITGRAPRITDRTPDTPDSYSTLSGESVMLACTANGDPDPHITWTKEGGALADNMKPFNSGKNLLLVDVGGSDSGNYTCTASNSEGSDSATFTVSVLRKSNDRSYSAIISELFSCSSSSEAFKLSQAAQYNQNTYAHEYVRR